MCEHDVCTDVGISSVELTKLNALLASPYTALRRLVNRPLSISCKYSNVAARFSAPL